MRKDAKLRSAIDRMRKVQGQMEQNEHAKALEELESIRKLQLTASASGYVAYLTAICFDVLGDSIMAYRSIEEALSQDPLSVPFNESFGIIVGGIRKSLAAADRDPADPSTPKLYDILVRSGEADTDSHLSMARHLMHQKDPEAALRILRAVTVLDASSPKAWELTAEAARQLGDAELEVQAKAEAAELSRGPETVFGIPGSARS